MGLEFLPILLFLSMMPFVLFVFLLSEATIQKEWIELHRENGWEIE